MIILDTNVLSVMMSKHDDEHVIEWFNQQDEHNLWLTAISVFEIEYGIALLPDGKRKYALKRAFEGLMQNMFDERIIPFDVEAANEASAIAGYLKQSGFNVDMRDIQIAGIVKYWDATLATRNEKDFQHASIEMINPWKVSLS